MIKTNGRIIINTFTAEFLGRRLKEKGNFHLNVPFLYNLLFNLYCPSVAKIFADLDENLPPGVVFCVDHESDIIFLIRDRDQG